MEPGQPIPVTCPASSEATDALLGTKGGSPRVVPDETKLAITNCASRGAARSRTFGAVQHCSLHWYYRRCSSIILFSPSHFMSLCAFPIVISRVPYTPRAILIIRDLFRGKMRFRPRPFERTNRCVLALTEAPQLMRRTIGRGRQKRLSTSICLREMPAYLVRRRAYCIVVATAVMLYRADSVRSRQ